MKVSETVYDGRLVKVVKRFEKDTPERFLEIVRHPGAAAVVALTKSGRLLLVSQYREATGGVLLEIPAGKLEPGERPEDCAYRELEEETGYRAGRLEELCAMFMSPGYCDEKIHIFAATGLEQSVANPDDDENVAPVEVELDEALRMIDDGRIRDAKTVAGVLEFVRKKKWSLASGTTG
jgi:ADP-ribose pyrophosphatase